MVSLRISFWSFYISIDLEYMLLYYCFFLRIRLEYVLEVATTLHQCNLLNKAKFVHSPTINSSVRICRGALMYSVRTNL